VAGASSTKTPLASVGTTSLAPRATRPAESFAAWRVGVGGVTQPGAVGEHGGPLRGGETHLRGELAGLFHAVVEFAGEVAVEEDDGLGGEEAVFGAAEGEHVDTGAPGEIGGRAVAAGLEGGAGVGETGAVEVDGNRVGVREVGERAEFGRRVDRAELGRLRERQRPELREVHAVSAMEDRVRGRRAGASRPARRSGSSLLPPVKNSGAPHSSVSTCANSWQRMRVMPLAERGQREGVGGGAVENEEDVARGLEDVGQKFFRAGRCGRRRRSSGRGRRWRRRGRPRPPGRPRRCCRWRRRNWGEGRSWEFWCLARRRAARVVERTG
jgi:hypothetical protein